MVECFLAKEDVAGSTPVSRSKTSLPALHFPYTICRAEAVSGPIEARYPSGKGEVCKTFMRRFDPDPRLQNPLNNLEQLTKPALGLWPPIRQATGV